MTNLNCSDVMTDVVEDRLGESQQVEISRTLETTLPDQKEAQIRDDNSHEEEGQEMQLTSGDNSSNHTCINEDESISCHCDDQTVKHGNNRDGALTSSRPLPPSTIWTNGESAAKGETEEEKSGTTTEPKPKQESPNLEHLAGLAVIDYLNKKGMGGAALQLAQILQQETDGKSKEEGGTKEQSATLKKDENDKNLEADAASAAASSAEATGYVITKTEPAGMSQSLPNHHHIDSSAKSMINPNNSASPTSVTDIANATDQRRERIMDSTQTSTSHDDEEPETEEEDILDRSSRSARSARSSRSARSFLSSRSSHRSKSRSGNRRKNRSRSGNRRKNRAFQRSKTNEIPPKNEEGEEEESAPSKRRPVQRSRSAGNLMRKVARASSGKWKRPPKEKVPTLTDFFPAECFDSDNNNNKIDQDHHHEDLSRSERSSRSNWKSKWSKRTTSRATTSDDGSADQLQDTRSITSSDAGFLPSFDGSDVSATVGNTATQRKRKEVGSSGAVDESIILDMQWAKLDMKWANLDPGRDGMASMPDTRKEKKFWSRKGLPKFEWKKKSDSSTVSDEQLEQLKSMFPDKRSRHSSDYSVSEDSLDSKASKSLLDNMALDDSILDKRWKDVLSVNNGMSSAPQTEDEFNSSKKRKSLFRFFKRKKGTDPSVRRGKGTRRQSGQAAFDDVASIEFGSLDSNDGDEFQKQQEQLSRSDRHGSSSSRQEAAPKTNNKSSSGGILNLFKGEKKRMSLLGGSRGKKSSNRKKSSSQNAENCIEV